MQSFNSTFLPILLGDHRVSLLLDLLLLFNLHLLGLLIPDIHILQQLLGLLLLPPLLLRLLLLLLPQVLLPLHRFQIVIVSLLNRFIVLPRHQQYIIIE